MTESAILVLDSGVQTTRIGYGGNLTPEIVIPTYISKDKKGLELKNFMKESNGSAIFKNFNDNAMDTEDLTNPTSPIHVSNPLSQFGYIENWNGIQELWKYALHVNMKVDDLSDKNLFITEAPQAPKPSREKLTRVAFESFGVKGFYISNQAVLGLCAAGRVSGTVLDVGYKTTKIVPILEGRTMHFASDIVELGGDHVTTYLQDLLMKKYPEKSNLLNNYTVERIKHDLCYTYCSSWNNGNQPEKRYQLPDNSTVVLNDEMRRTAVEILFAPHQFLKMENNGITSNLNRVIGSCEFSTRKDLYANIILSGGGTMIPYFGDRVRQEIDELAPAATVVGVVTQKERRFGSYVGSAIISSLSSFSNNWLTKQEYDDWGAHGIHRKCLT